MSLFAKFSACAAIVGLLFSSSPAAVVRCIVAVVINALDCVLRRRPWPHVAPKVCKIVPAITNGDAASAVSVVGRMVRIAAAVPHAFPYVVKRRSFTAMHEAFAAVARIASSVPKVGAHDRPLHATLTPAQPHIPSVLVERMGAENGPFAERPTSQVYEAVATASRMLSSHVPVPLCLRNVVRAAGRFAPSGCSHYSMNQAG